MADKPGIYLRGGSRSSFDDPDNEVGDREIVLATDTGELGLSSQFFVPGGRVRNIYFAQTPAERQEIYATDPIAINGLSVSVTPEFIDSSFVVIANIVGTFNYASGVGFYVDNIPLVQNEDNDIHESVSMSIYTGENNTSVLRSYSAQAIVSPQTTQSITIDVRAISKWQGTTYTTYINDTANNNARSISSMVVYEVKS